MEVRRAMHIAMQLLYYRNYALKVYLWETAGL